MSVPNQTTFQEGRITKLIKNWSNKLHQLLLELLCGVLEVSTQMQKHAEIYTLSFPPLDKMHVQLFFSCLLICICGNISLYREIEIPSTFSIVTTEDVLGTEPHRLGLK